MAKEFFRSFQCLRSCGYNKEIALSLTTDPFHERLRISSTGRSFDTQSGRCAQDLCFLLKGVSAL